jgi:hypothetical protein
MTTTDVFISHEARTVCVTNLAYNKMGTLERRQREMIQSALTAQAFAAQHCQTEQLSQKEKPILQEQ